MNYTCTYDATTTTSNTTSNISPLENLTSAFETDSTKPNHIKSFIKQYHNHLYFYQIL